MRYRELEKRIALLETRRFRGHKRYSILLVLSILREGSSSLLSNKTHLSLGTALGLLSLVASVIVIVFGRGHGGCGDI
jgi:hypothetical protein